MSKKIKNNSLSFVRERDEALVEAFTEKKYQKLEEYVENYCSKDFRERFKKADEEVKRIAVCKCLCVCINVDKDIRASAERWLLENGYSKDF